MDIISNRKETIYRRDFENKTFYSIGIAKKKQDGSYENGYADVVFNKDVVLENKAQIIIKKAWLDFYVKDKKTHLFIRVSEFEKVKEEKKQDGWDSAKNIEIDDDELPFY